MFKEPIQNSLDKVKILTSNNTVIYSALTDSYDEIIDPPAKFKNTDFILFTDSAKRNTSKIWKTHKID